MAVIYDPSGNAFGSETSETVDNHFEFANYYWDSTVGMYYLNARWYDPVILRFTGRDPVCGSFEEPMTLHVYLYCQNDWINRTDPTGELWGVLRRVYRIAYGISAYYTALDVALQAATSPWDIMDVAIAANEWREAYFTPENLNKPFGWEVTLQQGFEEVFNKIANTCEWKDLGKCVAPNIILPALDISGIITCAICGGTLAIPDPIPGIDEAISCGFCSMYMKYVFPVTHNPVVKKLSTISTLESIALCVKKHCGK